MLRKSKLPLLSPPIHVPSPELIEGVDIQTEFVTVTPDQAAKWLDEYNTNNRTIREAHAQRMATDMKNGKWRGRNGEAIRFDVEGRLVDGQHRLWACVLAGVPFETLLVRGINPEDYATIGIGAKKSMADFLGPVLREKNVSLLASVLKLVFFWKNAGLDKQSPALFPSIAQLQTVYESNPSLGESVSFAANNTALRAILNPSYAALIHYAGVTSGMRYEVENYLGRLADGLGLMPKDPVYHVRKILLAERGIRPGMKRTGKLIILALVIKGWNLAKAKKETPDLRFRVGEKFPIL